jgi:SSS family transporter
MEVEMKTYVIVFLIIYAAAMIWLGFLGRKKSKMMKDFALAGTAFGGVLAGLSIFASWMSASTFMGVPALFNKWGWPAFAQACGVALGAPLAILFTVTRIRKYSQKLGSLTFPDLIADRYDSEIIRLVINFLVIMMYLMFMVAQLKATGLIFKEGVGLKYETAVFLGLAIVFLYIVMGGMWASLITDNVQAIAMMLAVVVLLPAGLIAVGGFDGLYNGLAKINQNYVTFTEPKFWHGGTVAIQPFFWFLCIFALPYTMNRCMVLKGVKEVKRFILAFWVGNTLGMVFMISGGVVRVLYPEMKTPDAASIYLAARVLPPLAAAFILMGIFAASMSSVDSILHAAGAAIGNDVYRKVIVPWTGGNPEDPRVDRIAVIISRVAVFGFCVIPLYIALTKPPAMLSLFMYGAIGFVSATSVSPLLLGLFWKGGTRIGVYCSMGVGFFMYLYLWKVVGMVLYISSPIAVVTSGVVLVVVSLIERTFGAPTLPRNKVALVFSEKE